MSDVRFASATIASEIRIFGLTEKSSERLRLALRLTNPEWTTRKIYRRPTEGIEEYVECLTEHPDGSVIVPRGSIQLLQSTLKKDCTELRFTSNGMTQGDPIPECPPVNLWPHQRDALDRATKAHQGVIVIPCGGGKTTLGIAIVGTVRKKTLVVVHTNDLLDQWVTSVKHLLNLECGTIMDNKFSDGPVVIAMVQTLANMLDQDPKLCERFGIVLFDEAHHTPAKSYQRILPRCPAKWRIALTATPDREDRMTKLMDWSFGERIFEISTKKLVAQGHLMMPQLEIVETEFEFQFNGPKERMTAALQRALRADPKRNDLIASIAARDASQGEYVVVLSNDRVHCRTLGKLIWEKGIKPVVLLGAANTKSYKAFRKDALQGMRDGTVHIIIATSLFDEAVDIPRLSRVILAGSQKAKGATQQKTGRAMRLFPGKKPKIYDIVDRKVETLVRRFQDRQRKYREMGLLR